MDAKPSDPPKHPAPQTHSLGAHQRDVPSSRLNWFSLSLPSIEATQDDKSISKTLVPFETLYIQPTGKRHPIVNASPPSPATQTNAYSS
ncbi:hypothetical protein PIIN_05784 [Serendipita indica DSM 11827]|uniref:Uncharacterized protein n=1 Tax=Serendipita indica (strain DSM 11827) TaxID=1109443 RepID=G4TKK6_SERID|nr:hypothetical protein PIIN_05784 [Serendipita indica DSM 11827]